MGLVCGVVPPAHDPEDQGREEGTHGVYLSLYRTEPEGIGEAVGHCANSTGREDCYGLADRIALRGLDNKTPCKEDDCKVQEKDGETAQDCVHGVHGHGGVRGVKGNCEEACQQLEHGVSRRVTYFQLV